MTPVPSASGSKARALAAKGRPYRDRRIAGGQSGGNSYSSDFG